ncbi:tripartite tricarboxylate transporter TctB family protein [uncultured Amphritea sp.]|mgnify:CR=1 FL=1|uniref:tripartite tricarboxylate transporter TctB family protein n=1 Tax=uncultured Amphritea sp. TaxID=981605 RepID=UPI0025D26B8C|nr:tripartite tricarboxylate transporter TctB family protein [uncultured Amphritea sp.]
MSLVQKGTALLAALLAIIATVLIVAGPELVPVNEHYDAVYKSPLFFPYIALGLIIIGAIPLAIKACNGLRVVLDLDVETTSPRLRLVTVMLIVFSAYTLLIPWTGYFLASVAFVCVTMFIVGFRGLPLLLKAIGFSTLLYALFVLGLDVWFPDSWLLQQFRV